MRKKPIDFVYMPFRRFLELESASGIVLIIFTLIALILANSPLQEGYFHLRHISLSFSVDTFFFSIDFEHMVNDAFMCLFFFVIGLELKREFVEGELKHPKTAALPIIAALGGMIVPALLFISLNGEHAASHGWGVPMATDIAFAVGVLTLLGRLVSNELRLFLLTLAVVDDIGAIIVIALFYSNGIDMNMLGGVAVSLALIVFSYRLGIRNMPFFIFFALIAWYFMAKSGIHATILGVLLGLLVPTHTEDGDESMLDTLEKQLHPWNIFFVLPAFALFNAGFEITVQSLFAPLSFVVAAALVFGKPIGVVLFSYAAVLLRVVRLPKNTTFVQMLGIGLLAGIGFTMSLFIAALAFSHPILSDMAKGGILLASLVAGISGYIVLRYAGLRNH